MQWPPDYSKIILEVGDEHAIHTGGTGGLTVSSSEASAESDEAPVMPSYEAWESLAEKANDPYLAPFLEFFHSRQDLG